MRLVMTLLVRDEAGIVRENLDFHLSQGVDFAIVMDNRSGDGTTELLEAYEARGLIRLLRQPGVYDQASWQTEMARLAVHEEGADWVIPNDADEFWCADAGTLRDAIAAAPPGAGGLVCERHTFVPTPEDGRAWWERMTLRQRDSVNERGRPLRPKVIHRAAPDLVVRKGNHRREPTAPGATVACSRIEVLHFQMRTYEQFEHGVIVRGRTLRHAERPDQRFNRARRREFRIWRRGGLEGYYAERVVTGPGPGVVTDTRLRDRLEALYPNGPLPALPPSRSRAARGGTVSIAAGRLRALPARLVRGVTRSHNRRDPAPDPAPFIVGVPRSGTTLLRLMLDAHPLLAIGGETHYMPALFARWRELEARGVPEAERIAPCIELMTSHPRWPDLGVERGDLEAHLAGLDDTDLADLARAVPMLCAGHAGKPRWGEKTPGYMTSMLALRRVLREARFIHVIRDGRDVALSLREVAWGTDDVELAARRWKRRIRNARRQSRRLPEGSYMEVRFEDLVTDPEPVLKRVTAFADLPWDEAMLSYHEQAAERMTTLARDVQFAGVTVTAAERRGQHALVAEPPRPERAERWRAEMDPADRRRFDAVAGRLLERLGYRVGEG